MNGFREWLLKVEAAAISPNINMPGHLRPLDISVSRKWLMSKHAKAGGNPKHTFKRKVKSDKFFDTFFPGKDIHITVKDDNNASFWTQMNFGYEDKTGWDAWTDARKKSDQGSDVEISLIVDLAPIGTKRSEEAYLAGYTDHYGNTYGFRLSDEEEKRYLQGKYDATHFYAYGASAPDLPKAPVKQGYAWGWKPSDGTIMPSHWRGAVQPAFNTILDEELRRKYPPKLVAYIRKKIVSSSSYRYPTHEFMKEIEKRILHSGENLGIDGAREIIRKFIDTQLDDILDQHDDKLRGEIEHLRQTHARVSKQPPRDPEKTRRISGWGHSRDVTAQEDWEDYVAYLAQRMRGAERRLKGWKKRYSLRRQPQLPFGSSPATSYDFVKEDG